MNKKEHKDVKKLKNVSNVSKVSNASKVELTVIPKYLSMSSLHMGQDR